MCRTEFCWPCLNSFAQKFQVRTIGLTVTKVCMKYNDLASMQFFTRNYKHFWDRITSLLKFDENHSLISTDYIPFASNWRYCFRMHSEIPQGVYWYFLTMITVLSDTQWRLTSTYNNISKAGHQNISHWAKNRPAVLSHASYSMLPMWCTFTTRAIEYNKTTSQILRQCQTQITNRQPSALKFKLL